MNTELEFNGFEEQNRAYDCGAHAIRHSLLALGIPTSHTKVTRSAGTLGHWGSYSRYGDLAHAGTSEKGICNGLRRCGMDFEEFEDNANAIMAKAFLDESMAMGCPVILSADNTRHWMAAIGKVDSRYLIADSLDMYKYANSKKAVALYSWEQLIDNRWYYSCWDCGEDVDERLDPGETWCPSCDGYCENDRGEECTDCEGTGVLRCTTCDGNGYWFYAIRVIPKTEEVLQHSSVTRSSTFGKTLVANQQLQEFWGYFLADLLACQSSMSKARATSLVTVASIIEAAAPMLISRAEYWLAFMNRSQIQMELGHYMLVASAYDFRVPETAVGDLLQDFTMAFTMTLVDWYA